MIWFPKQLCETKRDEKVRIFKDIQYSTVQKNNTAICPHCFSELLLSTSSISKEENGSQHTIQFISCMTFLVLRITVTRRSDSQRYFSLSLSLKKYDITFSRCTPKCNGKKLQD